RAFGAKLMRQTAMPAEVCVLHSQTLRHGLGAHRPASAPNEQRTEGGQTMRYFALTASVLFFLVAAGCGSMQAPAQSGRHSQNPLAQGNTLNAGASPRTAIVVGELGTILRTTNGGGTWTIQDSGTTDKFLGVALADTSVGAVAGETIVQTTDGGVTWQRNYDWIAATAAYFVDANNGWAVGAPGELVGVYGRDILHTTNGGA